MKKILSLLLVLCTLCVPALSFSCNASYYDGNEYAGMYVEEAEPYTMKDYVKIGATVTVAVGAICALGYWSPNGEVARWIGGHLKTPLNAVLKVVKVPFKVVNGAKAVLVKNSVELVKAIIS